MRYNSLTDALSAFKERIAVTDPLPEGPIDPNLPPPDPNPKPCKICGKINCRDHPQ